MQRRTASSFSACNCIISCPIDDCLNGDIMIIKIRNWSLVVVVIAACAAGFAGPIMYPEMMVNATYMPML